MLMAQFPIAVIMQRRSLQSRWADYAWSAIGIAQDPGGLPSISTLTSTAAQEDYLVSGLQLELHRDENDGYFENWIAPEPKVFVMWRMEQDRAMPVLASVSYGEGTRMLDSGETVDGVPMPLEIHQWLGAYLQAHYQPRRQSKERTFIANS